MRSLFISLFLFWSCVSASYAVTEALEVYFLPLHEASDAVKTQLSSEGKVVEIHSKRMLLVDDKDVYIKKAKALLKRLDKPVSQLTVQVKIEDVSRLEERGITGKAFISPLSGGWVKLAVGQQLRHTSHRSRYQLRVSANKPGRIEAGVVQSFNRETRRWLRGYGVIQQRSIELIPISTGFYVRARLVANGLVHVRITPWVKRVLHDGVDNNQNVLIDLGKNGDPAIPNSYLRYNAKPKSKQNQEIAIAGAATELTIRLGEEVSIAAVDHEAEMLAKVLLGRYSKIGKRQFVMRLKISN